MSRYYGGWAPYVPVAERRRKAERKLEKLRKAGHPVAPVTIAGRLIATTFWGRAWCDNMESYRDYESRLPRGRTYVRNGSVVDLQVAPGRITAMVSGSELYNVSISIKEAVKTQWRAICADCAGGIDSLVELLQGRFSKGVMERLCRQEGGLFPRPADIRFSCSCPDHASMCKHVAAVLYGVGARLDHRPELLFRLRAVDEDDLVAGIGTALPLSNTGPAAAKVLEADELSALFGLDMAAPELPAAGKPEGKSSTARARGAALTVEVTSTAVNNVVPRVTAPKRAASRTLAAKPAPTPRATAARKTSAKAVDPKPTAATATSTKPPAPNRVMRAKSSSRPVALEKAVATVDLAHTRRKSVKAQEFSTIPRRTPQPPFATPEAPKKPARDRVRRQASKDKAAVAGEPTQKPVK